MHPLTIGIIGAGQAGRMHAAAYQALGNTVKVASDADPGRAEEFCREWEIQHYCQDYHEILYDKTIQAVSICTPTYLHAEMVLECLQSKKHILLEPPVALNLVEAQEILEAYRESKQICLLSCPYRFQTSSSILNELIRNDTFGSIYHIHIQLMRRRGLPGAESWPIYPRAAGGGVLMDLGTRALDLALHTLDYPKPVSLTGTVSSIFCPTVKEIANGEDQTGEELAVEDYAKAFIRLENGVSLCLEVAWAVNSEDSCFMRVLGTSSGAILEFENDLLRIFGEQNGYITDSQPLIKSVNPYEELISHFVAMIEDGQVPVVNFLEQGIVVQAIIDAIYESSRTSREVLF